MLEPTEKPKIVKVAPEKAAEWLELNTFAGQRGLTEKRVVLLRNKIEAGDFRTGEVAIARLEYEEGREVLMNGQHQLTACVRSKIGILVKLERYLCHGPLDASHLYRQFDNTQRSLSDMVKVEAVSMKLGWPPRLCSLVVSAGCEMTHRTNAHPTVKVKVLSEFLDEGAFMNRVLFETVPEGVVRDKYVKHLMRSPVAVAMMKTFRKSPAAALPFWLAVRDGTGLRYDQPEYKLREFLKETVFNEARSSQLRSGLRSASGHEIYARCITAWNAARKGRTTSLRYHANNTVPAPV